MLSTDTANSSVFVSGFTAKIEKAKVCSEPGRQKPENEEQLLTTEITDKNKRVPF